MADNKVKFIQKTTNEFFNIAPVSTATEAANIQEFLIYDEMTILVAKLTDDKTVAYQYELPEDESTALIFYKIPKLGFDESDEDNGAALQQIGFLTLNGGIIRTIYNTMDRIFSTRSAMQQYYTTDLKMLITNLQKNLNSSLGLPESNINSIRDEISFWTLKQQQVPTKADKEAAKTFTTHLESLLQFFGDNDKLVLDKIDDFLDSIHNMLDEIWRLPYKYPQNRMIGVLDVLSFNILDCCMDIVKKDGDINFNSLSINDSTNQILEITESWLQLCDSLTRLFWSNYGQHLWIGSPYNPKLNVKFKDRVEEALDIKNIFKQIQMLFGKDDKLRLNANELFASFKGINIYDITSSGEKRWTTAKDIYEIALSKIDEKIGSMLKLLIHRNLNNSRQIIYLFTKYHGVLKRPTILKILNAEREHLFQSLKVLITELKESMKNNNFEDNDVSVLVAETKWLKIIETQLKLTATVCEEYLSDRDDFAGTLKNLHNFIEEIGAQLKLNFETWCENSLEGIRKGELILRDNDPVVKFEKGERQLMTVTFNPKLITFCNDVNYFQNFGYRIPTEIVKSAATANNVISYARHLQQIAIFHNTIGDRMLPCHRPIMLESAVEFSRLVNSESVSWNNEKSIQRYLNVLQSAINKLSKQNAYLIGCHETARKSILKLMNADLINNSNVWKEEMKNLREIFVDLERQGYNNLNPFKLHLDYQLYKALEYQYILGLSDTNINQKIANINIDIIFRQQSILYRPSFEKIKLQYYSRLRKFLEEPLNFKGLSDQNGNIFKKMIERNRHRFIDLYRKADVIFKKLLTLQETWLPWIALGCVETEQLCQVHLSTWDHWDYNFKACKNFSQKIAKIQDSEEIIDCFVINLSPLRSDIEYISRRFWEALAMSLKTSTLNEISDLQVYLSTSLKLLEHIPEDEDGIIEASAKYEKIITDLPKMMAVLKSVENKDACLAGWCKERVSILHSILTQWNQLQPLIDNHQSLLQNQLDIIKGSIQQQITQLIEEAERFAIRWESTIKELEANEKSDMTLFKERQNQWTSIQEKRENLLALSEKFNTGFSDELNEKFANIKTEIEKYGEQWQIFEEFSLEHDKISNEEWSIYRRRPYILMDFLLKWEKHISAESTVSVAKTRISNIIGKYKSALSLLNVLQSDCLVEKHWTKIFILLERPVKPYQDILLADILSTVDKLLLHSDDIKLIIRQATSEQIILKVINELEQWSLISMLKVVPHVDSRGQSLTLLKDFSDVLNKIGDNQCLLQSAKNSAAYESFSEQAEIWESKLNKIDYILTNLNVIQRKWIYLEPIFSAGTLKSEEMVFKRIDKDFRYIQNEINQDLRVISLYKINNITAIIETLQKQLAKCQATLSTYIMTKRNAFSRFYFLSDDDLLEILGQSSKEEIIQKHITKIFPGISKLQLQNKDGKPMIIAICSADDDIILLRKPVLITTIVEDWLNQLVIEMKSVVKDLIRECYQHEKLTPEIIEKYPMQIFTLTNFLHFTKQTDKAILGMRLNDHLNSIQNEINKYTTLLKQTQKELSRIKIRSLLLDLVQQSSTIEYLIKHNVTNDKDWYWLQQMKFYMKNDKVIVQMVYAEFEYSYEFLGNYNKLVYTTLVHNCYLTLTQAMKLGLGGNPFGPAGTGKTECVKALGAILGRLVFVFNCSENVDTTAMGLILSGLSRCGAWGCFDEFNRLEETTLSAISMLIQPLQMALKDNKSNVILGNETVPLNLHCCIFVTLNPAGEEYGGRQKLPINLQLLFRPIVMEYPNPQEIAKVYLFVEGFKYAEQISIRVVELFNLAEKILSRQRHYDWGLRELKMVLSACGKLLNTNYDNNTDSDTNEMELVVRALRSNTMSRLTLADCKKFDVLIRDVFPKIKLETFVNTELRTKILESFSLMSLKPCDRQVEKCLELSEQLQKRMGVALIGPPGSGKSTLIALLKQAYTSMSKTIRTYTISPKSMNRVQLLGILDTDTRQWHDGVLTKTAIAVNSELPAISSWIICDGDIDPEWIEALNSVLDDNRLLTLPSGWRIQFGNNVNFIFETHDLSNASPATISRMGIINLSAEDLNSSLVIDSWLTLNNCDESYAYYIENYFNRAISWIENNQQIPKNLSKICLIKCGLKMLGNEKNKEEFCINLLRGLNSFLNCDMHNEFANMLFEWSNIYVSNQNRAEYYYYNSFRSLIELYELEDSGYIGEENKLVRTPMTQVNSDVLRNFLKGSNKNVVLLIGPNGCGKSLLLESIMAEYPNYQLVIINCSAQLTTKHILHTLKQNCLSISGVKGKEFKPKQTRLVLFFKNVDFCPKDKYGTCEIIEFLLQVINCSGFYSDNEEWISISGIQICCSLTNVKDTHISSRFLSICNILQMRYPEQNEIKKIIENYLMPIKQHFDNFTIANIDKLLNAIISIYNAITNNFKLDISNHYNFSPILIEKWITQLINYPKDKFVEAFCYECRCIFSDRLISSTDVEQFEMILEENLKNISLLSPRNTTVFVPRGRKSSSLQFQDTETWEDTLKRSIIHCNTENSTIEIPLTEEISQTVSALCRALSRPFTNIVLCGKTGSGRSESVNIACTIMQIKIFFPQTIASYSLNEFFNDLKLAMQSAALDNETVVFFINHSLISYLVEILKPCEAILEGSEIPELFNDDLETIANALKNEAQMDGYQHSLASYFLQRVKTNLHLVIALEETTNDLQRLFKLYPALSRKTELIWMKGCSRKNMEALPQGIIQNIEEQNGGTLDKDVTPVPAYFSNIVSLINVWPNSPRRYLLLIKTYYHIYRNQKQLKINHYNKLKIGVDRLSEAYALVEKLKIEAESKQEALTKKRMLATNALEMISATMRNANDQKTDLIDLKKQAEESSVILLKRKKVIEEELSLVEPLLREAIAAVGQIKTEALSEIRSLRAPPDTIRDILEGVLRLMGIRDTSWNSMKTFLAKRGIKEDIKLLDASRISPENCLAVEKLVEMKAESFDVKNAKRASVAAAPLAVWVVANIKYSKVIQSIKPLEREQLELQRNLEKAEADMKSLSYGLDNVNTRVQQLSDELNMHTQEAALLEIKLTDAKTVLKTAEILVDNLNNEYKNWNKELRDINLEIDDLEKNIILLSLCITHLSSITTDLRMKYLSEICEKMNINHFNLESYLATNQDKIIWESMGLTNDQQSIENAGIITKLLEIPYDATPIPLLLDPTGQACKWLCQYLLSMNRVFEMTSQNAERFTNILELAIRFGKILIVNDVNAIVPPLLSLFTSKIQTRFGKKLLQVGNKMLDFHENFQLILINKMNKFALCGSLAANVMILPFTITPSGLSYRLLSEWILLKEPELEEKRVKLLKNEGVLMKEKIKLQDNLLQELSSAQGDILKNETLLNTLNNIKESTVTIEKSLQESYQIRINLMEGYEKHRTICDKISKFYMGISHIYNLDVSKFLQLFLNVVRENITDNENYYQLIIRKSYIVLSRSTPKTKENLLALNICKAAFDDLVPENEWESFISNFMHSSDINIDDNLPHWIKSELRSKLSVLKVQHPQLYDILKLEEENLWKDFINPMSKKNRIPVSVTDFQKILISQILRPDQLIQTITTSVGNMLGFKNMSIPSPSIRTLAMECNFEYPIMLVTTSGIDPSQEIKETAEAVLGRNKYFEISIGKGQENTVSDLVRTAAESGKWICVKNVHLVPNWLTTIDDVLHNSNIKLSEHFKFWLISDTDVGLSETFMFKCYKVLLEPPSNIKYKVRYLFDQNSTLLSKQKDYKSIKLYISLFLLHSVMQQRRIYIPQGWCKWYDFADSDLKTAMDFIEWTKQAVLDWSVLQGLCKKIAYGGRINNIQDLEKLNFYVKKFLDAKIMNSKWQPPSLNISLPNSNSLEEYQGIIEQLPDSDTPEIFGLSASTSVSRDILLCRELLKELRQIHFHIDISQSFEKRIRPLMSLWKKLANGLSIEQTYNAMIKQSQASAEENSWEMFVVSEMKLARELYNEIHGILTTLYSAIKEIHNISDSLKQILSVLCENQTPREWKKIWLGPNLATDYIRAFVHRANCIEKLYHQLMLAGEGVINEINFADIFNVDAFLAALKLIKSRSLQISTSDLVIATNFTNKDIEPNSIKISNLMIDGGVFYNSKLNVSANTDGGHGGFYLTSAFYLSYVEKHLGTNYDKNSINIPLYTNISRDNLICHLPIPTNNPESEIICSGVGLIIPDTL